MRGGGLVRVWKEGGQVASRLRLPLALTALSIPFSEGLTWQIWTLTIRSNMERWMARLLRRLKFLRICQSWHASPSIMWFFFSWEGKVNFTFLVFLIIYHHYSCFCHSSYNFILFFHFFNLNAYPKWLNYPHLSCIYLHPIILIIFKNKIKEYEDLKNIYIWYQW